MITFRENNYFGQQFLFDFNGFKLFGIRQAVVDRHLERRRRLPDARTRPRRSAARWAGTAATRSTTCSTPTTRTRTSTPEPADASYVGYFDIWGI